MNTTSFHTGFVPLTPAEAERDRDTISRELGDRYRVDRYLARGGFATVWQAADLVEGVDVAVKRVEPTVSRGRDFFRELRALLVLNHPNVVRLVNFLDATPTRFLILELCRGGSLRAAISSKRRREQCWTPAAVTRLVREIAAGLAAAHAAGLTHRDLKPENVLFAASDENSPVKLADFGLAGLFHDDTGLLRSLTGSPAYMAPEQFTGRFNPASDVYALGIIAFELLTGDLPFRGSAEELARHHLHTRIPAVTLPPPWRTLLPRMLSKDAGERPTAAEVVCTLNVRPPVTPDIADAVFPGAALAVMADGDRVGVAFEDRLELNGEPIVPLPGVRQLGPCATTGHWYLTDTGLHAIQDGIAIELRRKPHGVQQWCAFSKGDTLATLELNGEQVSLVRNGALAWSLTIPTGGLKRHLAVRADGCWAVTAFDGEPCVQVRDCDGALLHETPLPGVPWQMTPWSGGARFALRMLTGHGFGVFSTRTRGEPIPLAGGDGAAHLAAAENGILAALTTGELRLWDSRRRPVPLNYTLPPGETLRGLALTPTHAVTLSLAGSSSILRRIRRPDLGETS